MIRSKNAHQRKRSSGKLFFGLTLGLLTLGYSPDLQAQSGMQENGIQQSAAGMARMTNTNLIMLPGNQVLTSYRINVTHLGFNTLETAQEYFEVLPQKFVHFEVQDAETVFLHLHLHETEVNGWTVKEWNDYLRK